jgi:IS30 family transposase
MTLRERKSRYRVIIKNQNKEAGGIALALINSLKNQPIFLEDHNHDSFSSH